MAGPSQAAGEDLEECCLCFQNVAYNVVLPCTCKVVYCTSCWDRALVASLKAQGMARCPTCRGPVRVDFDASTDRLRFSVDEEVLAEQAKAAADAEAAAAAAAATAAGEEGAPLPQGPSPEAQAQAAVDRASRTTARLLEQARPAQERKLSQYGAQRPHLHAFYTSPSESLSALPRAELTELASKLAELEGQRDADPADENAQAGEGEAADPVRRILALAGGEGGRGLAGFVASAREAEAPSCVCGSSLVRVGGKARLWKALLTFPGVQEAQREAVYQHLLGTRQALIVCDLCEAHPTTSDAVWTCENGNSTIFHPTSYDVCDKCFVKWTCNPGPRPSGGAAAAS